MSSLFFLTVPVFLHFYCYYLNLNVSPEIANWETLELGLPLSDLFDLARHPKGPRTHIGYM